MNEVTCIYADGEMIKTVLRNLLSNAIKFTKTKGKIVFSTEIVEKFVRVKIIDNGTGMSENQLSKLFGTEIFTTRGTANEKGTGLGLIICKEFAEKNGGQLTVESNEGQVVL